MVFTQVGYTNRRWLATICQTMHFCISAMKTATISCTVSIPNVLQIVLVVSDSKNINTVFSINNTLKKNTPHSDEK